LPLQAELTGGEASDYKGYNLLIDEDAAPAAMLLADRGYDADRIRADLAARGTEPVIPGRARRKVPITVDQTLYALRNQVERCFGKLKTSRRLATRYDKTANSYLGFVHIASVRLWLRHFAHTAQRR
jgi:transposase